MESNQLRNIVEAALLAAGNPLTLDQLKALFGDNDGPERQELRDAIALLQEDYAGRGIQIVEVASGFRVQVRDSMAQWLTRLWEDRPPRYSRALMETLAIVAYRQPVTRGDIEEIRGVAVTTNIIRTLLERDWIKVVGHRDVPGKPAMFGTTRHFLDYFGLKKLDELPPLAELAQLEPVSVQLELGTADQVPESDDSEAVTARDESSRTTAGEATEAAEASRAAAVSGNEEHTASPDRRFTDQTVQVTSAEWVPDDDEEEEDEDYFGSHADDDDSDDADGSDDTDDDRALLADELADESEDETSGSANVASLDRARATASRERESDFNAERANVLPLKKS